MLESVERGVWLTLRAACHDRHSVSGTFDSDVQDNIFRGISAEKGTGFTAVAAGTMGSIFSPWFWILALLFSVFFYFSAGFKNRALRILLFWIPTIITSALGFGFCGHDSLRAVVRESTEPLNPRNSSHSQSKYSSPCRRSCPHHSAVRRSPSGFPSDCTAPAESIRAAGTT